MAPELEAITEPQLVRYLFMPVEVKLEDDRARLHEHLTAWWSSVRRLGITKEAPTLEVGPGTALGRMVRLESEEHESGAESKLVHAALAQDGREAEHAWLLRNHDLLVAKVELHGFPGEPRAWGDLVERWRASSPEEAVPRFASEVEVFVGIADEARAWGDVDRAVQAKFGSGTSRPGALNGTDAQVWQLPSDKASRRLLALGRPAHAASFNAIVTADAGLGIGHPPALAACCGEGAKVGWMSGVIQEDVPKIRKACKKNDQAAADLADAGDGDGLVGARREHVSTRTGLYGLLWSKTRMDELQRSLDIAVANMQRLPTRGSWKDPGTPFALDRQTATTLRRQVGHELAYIRASNARSRDANELVDLRLRNRAADLAERSNDLTLLQSALLGALLAVLTTIQALDWKIDEVDGYEAPIVTAVTSFFLALPLLVSRWDTPYRWFDRCAGVLLGAAAGWLVLAVATHRSVCEEVVGATVGAVLAVVLLAVEHHSSRDPA